MCYNFIKIVENTLDKKNVWVRHYWETRVDMPCASTSSSPRDLSKPRTYAVWDCPLPPFWNEFSLLQYLTDRIKQNEYLKYSNLEHFED